MPPTSSPTVPAALLEPEETEGEVATEPEVEGVGGGLTFEGTVELSTGDTKEAISKIEYQSL